MKGALIGFGQVAEKAHLPALREHGLEIIAVCEASPARREAAKAALPGAVLYTSYEQLLEAQDRLEFVDICTPPFLHAEQSLAALKKGLHVLCEKPLALAPEELATLRRTAAMAGRALFTVHNWACSPQWLAAFEALPSIGEVRHAALTVERTQPAVSAVPGDWRREASMAGGGILIDHGWHALYLLHRLVGGDVMRAVAKLTPTQGAVEEEAMLYLEYPSSTATLFLTWKAAVRRNTAIVVGSKGSIELLDDEVLVRTAGGSERRSFDQALSAGSAHPTWLSAMLPDFVAECGDALRRGRNLEQASFALGMIHRAYLSARQGRNPLRAPLAPGRLRP